jgi:hypothetical protein
MTVRYPDSSASAKFLRGELRQVENRQVLRSLLAAWRACRKEWGEIWGGGEGFASLVASWSAASQDYDQAFANLPARLAERSGKVLQERERMGALLKRFQSSTAQERKALVVADEDFRDWLFCDWLIESCPGHRESGQRDFSGREAAGSGLRPSLDP